MRPQDPIQNNYSNLAEHQTAPDIGLNLVVAIESVSALHEGTQRDIAWLVSLHRFAGKAAKITGAARVGSVPYLRPA